MYNILSFGTIASAPAYVPSPQHLALAVTLLVHPSTTTRAKTSEEEEAPGAALQLLRLTNRTVGPVSARFNVAFAFTDFASHGGRRRRKGDDLLELTAPRGDDDDEPLNLDLAQTSSVWSRANDFWHAVGWAFNCSVLHPKRWERWQVWLEFMCEAIEADWNERRKRARDWAEDTDVVTPARTRERILKESLIYRYIKGGGFEYRTDRRIIKAIFADGTQTAVNNFGEVFHNELKEPKKKEEILEKANAKRRAQVNIDQDEYADYLLANNDDSDEPDRGGAGAPAAARRSKRVRKGTKPSDAEGLADAKAAADPSTKDPYADNGRAGVAALGGVKALELRQRLLRILSDVSRVMPRSFMKPEELFHLFIEQVRHLSLPAFQLMVHPSTLPWFDAWTQSSLCEQLLSRLIDTNAPVSDEPYLTQRKLQECYLPYAASSTSAVDNARVSILLESLLVLLSQEGMLRNTPGLREAVETGNLQRSDKAGDEIRRNKNSRLVEAVEWCWLLESGDRLLFMVHDILPPEDLPEDDNNNDDQ